MLTAILDAAEVARNRFVKGEIEAGLVFAANAIEYQYTNPSRAATFRANAEDCYETAVDIVQQAGSMKAWPLELGAMLAELQQRLNHLRNTELVSSAAA